MRSRALWLALLLCAACTPDATAAPDSGSVAAPDAGAGDLDASRGLPPPPPRPDAGPPEPAWPIPEWTPRAPDEAGFDAVELDAAATYAGSIGSTCLLVVQDGELVFERYFDGAGPETATGTWSVAKTFTAALVGIAIEQGHLPGVDARVVDYVPEWRGTSAEPITIRDLLQMTSGLHWDFLGDYSWTLFSDDMTADAIALPVDDPPGAVWHYNNHAVQVLEAVLERATGQDVEAFARAALWGPLGMSRPSWNRDRAGNVTTFMNVVATCRDLARFGLLLERGGAWAGARLIDPAFVSEMTRASQPLNRGYGWLVWVNEGTPAFTAADELFDGPILPDSPPDTFSLQGFGQSFVDVLPSRGTIFVHVRPAPHDPPTRFVTDPGGTLASLLDDANRAEHRRLNQLLVAASR